MPYIQYGRRPNFRDDTMLIIEAARAIIAEYDEQGYKLTLRQLYYQFVARDLIPNTQRSYDKLGRIVSDARMAGMLDWQSIEDRTRNLGQRAEWNDPANVMRAAANGYAIDLWQDQPRRVEVWVEKEALAGVVERSARRWGVPWFACRGYVSQSAQWEAGQRFRARDEPTIVLHLGDHDPSGIDMTRDNRDRLRMFSHYEDKVTVRRIALNMDQIEELRPPENPAKMTDSRVGDYIAQFGTSSWELDALSPSYIDGLIAEHIESIYDPELWQARHEEQERQRALLLDVSDRWDEVVDFIENEE